MEHNELAMTAEMQILYRNIVGSLGLLPPELKEFIFGAEGEEDIEWIVAVADYIVLEFIKYSYDYSDPEYSLRHFMKNDDDSERMLQSRTMRYVLKYKKKEIEGKGGCISANHKFADTDMDTIEQKLKGHRLTEMNFFEHQVIHNLGLVKAIVEKRIISSKKISNECFQEMFEQYDAFIMSLLERSKVSDRDMVFASLAFFTFEWHYSIEILYYLSCLMEKEKILTIDKESLVLICGSVALESQFVGKVATDSRMVKERKIILPFLFGKDTDENERIIMKELIKEILSVNVYENEMLYTGDELYKEWFRRESTMEDWASFLRIYDIFSVWQKKEWTRARIQNMRYLFEMLLSPDN